MNSKKYIKTGILVTIVILFVMSCQSNVEKGTHEHGDMGDKSHMEMEHANQMSKITKAICVLSSTEGNETSGIVTFTQSEEGVKIVAQIEGLTEGKHGFHIHQYGDCSAVDGTSAGGHFNPEGKKHGSQMDHERHIGDLGNVVANAEGKAYYEKVDKEVSLNGKNSIIGRGIIVHAGEDDLKSQPTGNAGARVACGVIGVDE